MKKYIFMLLLIIFFPYIFCMVGSLFSDTIRIGQGDKSIEHNRLGKDVLIEINGLYKTMDVEEYILGVLPGTISADYDMEALKVQAILIRTNVLKEMEEKGSSDAADLSYQYLTMEECQLLFGERNYKKYNEKFEKAVVTTSGKVLRQEGSLIMALYHEVSIGKTIGAKEILGEDISYLQSVDSSQDVEAKNYMNVISYTWEELQELEGSTATEAIDENTPAEVKRQEIEVTEATENGFVKKLSVNETIYTGEEAMEKYKLSSANFYVEDQENGIRFVCLGKGNCMGVSQHGANCMALQGMEAKDIINYYYKNVSLEDYK